MPNLTFVLPHWMYWLGLLAVPLLAMTVIHRGAGKPAQPVASLPIAYFLWLTGGFIGLHRFYLKSMLGLVYIPLFVAILLCNVEARETRNHLSLANNELTTAEFLEERARKRLDEGRDGAAAQLDKARERGAAALQAQAQAQSALDDWIFRVRAAALAILALMLLDAALLPGLYRRCREVEGDGSQNRHIEVPRDPDFEPNEPVQGMVDRINNFAGNFVAYWSVIAVIVYYYEVLARYVFNSPTNWAHESMFLMFGMQYLLAGGFVLSRDGHVRVDVVYMHFSRRGKALVDVFTSLFFFIFATTLAWTGWVFFMDSFSVREVSFTEWGIQYWPVKFALPLGAALLLLQGLARLIDDIATLTKREA